MKSAIRTLADLGDELVFAPERYVADAGAGEGVPLGELVDIRTEAISQPNGAHAPLILDTTHARDGVLDIASARRAPATAKSTKKAALAGDVIVSRLRPYLRQVAYVHPAAIAAAGRSLAVSSEFYVLAPLNAKDDLAFLVPFLLSERVQAILAASQEGGHHPRVPRASLLALRVPTTVVKSRRERSKMVLQSLAAVYRASTSWHALL